MEMYISKEDKEALGFNKEMKERIFGLIHDHLGNISGLTVRIVKNPDGVELDTGIGTIVVDRAITKRIDSNGGIAYAPWSQKQINNLKAHQSNRHCHPFTCGNRSTPGHKEHADKNNERDVGILVPTKQGWICSVCDYTQNWAYISMLGNST